MRRNKQQSTTEYLFYILIKKDLHPKKTQPCTRRKEGGQPAYWPPQDRTHLLLCSSPRATVVTTTMDCMASAAPVQKGALPDRAPYRGVADLDQQWDKDLPSPPPQETVRLSKCISSSKEKIVEAVPVVHQFPSASEEVRSCSSFFTGRKQNSWPLFQSLLQIFKCLFMVLTRFKESSGA